MFFDQYRGQLSANFSQVDVIYGYEEFDIATLYGND